MNRFYAFTLVVAAILSVAGASLLGQSGANRRAAGDYIVVFHDDEPDVDGTVAEHQRAYGASVAQSYRRALKGYAATIPLARVDDIRRDPRVAFVSPDRAVAAVAQALPTGVARVDAVASSHYSSNTWTGIAVAVLDTGTGPHTDLNVAGGKNCVAGKGFGDGNGHGTHVGGTIGAITNKSGVVGVAPGIPMYSVRVLDSKGSGTWSSVICGVEWVTANAARLKIKVANMSLGGPGADDGNCGAGNADALHKAICGSVAAGVTYVAAAGNSGINFSQFVPAAYDEVLTVTAMTDFNGAPGGGAGATCRTGTDDTVAEFSNFSGSEDTGHTISAPGTCIYSTWKTGYSTISGTSMASPHVAGTAALCIAAGRCSGTPFEVMDQLRSDASVQPTGRGFLGDPSLSPDSGRYYGYLVYAGGY